LKLTILKINITSNVHLVTCINNVLASLWKTLKATLK